MHLCIHACAPTVPRRLLVFMYLWCMVYSVYGYRAGERLNDEERKKEPPGPQLSRHYTP